MKKTWVIVVNVLIMAAMLTFVVIYSDIENRNTTQVQIEHFENTTITMRHVTENYLEGEQRICDVWARYINTNNLTIDDAVSFIRNVFRENGNQRILKVIIDIADILSVPMIAEGVETERQMNTLREMGCEMVQGYYFSPPVPAVDFERHIEKWLLAVRS